MYQATLKRRFWNDLNVIHAQKHWNLLPVLKKDLELLSRGGLTTPGKKLADAAAHSFAALDVAESTIQKYRAAVFVLGQVVSVDDVFCPKHSKSAEALLFRSVANLKKTIWRHSRRGSVFPTSLWYHFIIAGLFSIRYLTFYDCKSVNSL